MRVARSVKPGMLVTKKGNWIVPIKNKRQRPLGVWQGEQKLLTPSMTPVDVPAGAVVYGICNVRVKAARKRS